MKRIIFVFMGLILVLSCRQEKKSVLEPLTGTKAQTLSKTRGFIEFDWTAPQILKQRLINNITQKKDSTDILIVKFLNDYKELNKKFNFILNDLKYYDSLNTWAYSVGEVYQIAKDFEKHVNNNGFLLSSSEGLIYIAESADYIKKDILNIVDPYSQEYLNQYCNQVENICCDDAAIIISEEEIVNRIYNWGELLGKVQNLKYAELVEGHFYGNLYLLYEGQENTPAFNMETNGFNKSLLVQMKLLIKKHPDSKASIEFQDFIDLLSSQGYMKTNKVINYIKHKTNQTSRV